MSGREDNGLAEEQRFDEIEFSYVTAGSPRSSAQQSSREKKEIKSNRKV